MIESNKLVEQLNYERFRDIDKIAKFKVKLRLFVKDYISNHTYVSSNKLARLYLEHRNYKGYNKYTLLHRLSNRFGKILVEWVKAGKLVKYNSKQYKRVL